MASEACPRYGPSRTADWSHRLAPVDHEVCCESLRTCSPHSWFHPISRSILCSIRNPTSATLVSIVSSNATTTPNQNATGFPNHQPTPTPRHPIPSIAFRNATMCRRFAVPGSRDRPPVSGRAEEEPSRQQDEPQAGDPAPVRPGQCRHGRSIHSVCIYSDSTLYPRSQPCPPRPSSPPPPAAPSSTWPAATSLRGLRRRRHRTHRRGGRGHPWRPLPPVQGQARPLCRRPHRTPGRDPRPARHAFPASFWLTERCPPRRLRHLPRHVYGA